MGCLGAKPLAAVEKEKETDEDRRRFEYILPLRNWSLTAVSRMGYKMLFVHGSDPFGQQRSSAFIAKWDEKKVMCRDQAAMLIQVVGPPRADVLALSGNYDFTNELYSQQWLYRVATDPVLFRHVAPDPHMLGLTGTPGIGEYALFVRNHNLWMRGIAAGFPQHLVDGTLHHLDFNPPEIEFLTEIETNTSSHWRKDPDGSYYYSNDQKPTVRTDPDTGVFFPVATDGSMPDAILAFANPVDNAPTPP